MHEHDRFNPAISIRKEQVCMTLQELLTHTCCRQDAIFKTSTLAADCGAQFRSIVLTLNLPTETNILNTATLIK